MAWLLPRSVFIHVPKTGGQWVAAALEEAGLLAGTVGPIHASPEEIAGDPEVAARSHRFAFVRNPLTWYRSMWAHRMDEGWAPVDDPQWFTPRWIEAWAPFTDAVRAQRFDRFVRNVVAEFPDGFLSSLYEAYTDGCTQVGRYEHLAEDLVRILSEIGERFDPDRVRRTPPRNVRGDTPTRRRQAEWTPDLVALVQGAERRAFARYGYAEVPA